MSEKKTTREILLAAAAYIEEHGWTQGAMSRGGKVCARGAIDRVCGGRPMPAFCAEDRLRWWLKNNYAVTSIEQFNDCGARTASDVIAALRAAAEGQA